MLNSKAQITYTQRYLSDRPSPVYRLRLRYRSPLLEPEEAEETYNSHRYGNRRARRDDRGGQKQ